MSTIEEQIKSQQETIRLLSETVTRSEARYQSLHKAMRWLGVVVIGCVLFVGAFNFDMVTRAKAQGGAGGPTSHMPPECRDLKNNGDKYQCGIVASLQQFGMQTQISSSFNRASEIRNTIIAVLDNNKRYLSQQVQDPDVKDCLASKETQQEKTNCLNKLFGDMMMNNELTLMDQVAMQLQITPAFIRIGTLQRRILNFKKKLTAGSSAERKILQEKYGKLLAREEKLMTKLASHMSLMDHIANIDLDFNNLEGMAQKMADLRGLGKKVDGALTTITTLMPPIAADAHNISVSAAYITRSAVPTMNRMDDSMRWMPWSW
ncbi:MAG: hypothetical protein GY862_10170 [Gammaproteobacteria bacterium]|nr:hypothetical protein [Gammaproteobacteria bacterium]